MDASLFVQVRAVRERRVEERPLRQIGADDSRFGLEGAVQPSGTPMGQRRRTSSALSSSESAPAASSASRELRDRLRQARAGR